MDVGLFFYVDGKFFFHRCSLSEAIKNGKFLNYPLSHYDIWNRYYYRKYQVDFDYYPRGRIIYNSLDDVYYIYHDKCIKDLSYFLDMYSNYKVKVMEDFHYQCHLCNEDYVDI